ncbi:MAG: hypothetical protein AB1847_10460 [bacterium]
MPLKKGGQGTCSSIKEKSLLVVASPFPSTSPSVRPAAGLPDGPPALQGAIRQPTGDHTDQ